MFPDERIETPRLILRAFQRSDIPAVAVACADEITQRWLPLPRPYTLEHAESWCLRDAPRLRADGDGIQLAMAHGDSDRLVGGICLKRTSWQRGQTEIGYWTAPGDRGIGYATEATRALSKWAFGDTRIHRVELTAATGNIASQRVAERAGFHFEGVARSGGYVHAGRVDLRIYSLIRSDLSGI